MLLAGGQGSRLGALTKRNAKPGVAFGGKYRIIDFGLSNCANSGIDTVGVLTQYKPLILNAYLGNGSAWDLDVPDGGLQVLQPYATETGGRWYDGTADAIYRNMDFIDRNNPEYVIILSGDHIYKMDYNEMLAFHKQNRAALTVSVIEVPWDEAPRFGIMSTDDDMRITKFAEKPKNPESNLASMGIYIFTWKVLRQALIEDHANPESEKDFGKNIIPDLLKKGERLFAYKFSGYWKDVGTIDSYYDSQMELLTRDHPLNIMDEKFKVYSNSNMSPPHYIGENAEVYRSLVCNGCEVYGTVRNSILGPDVIVGEGAEVEDSILLPGSKIGAGAVVRRAIVGEEARVADKAELIGTEGPKGIAVLGDNADYKGV